MGLSLAWTGDIVEGRAHYDQGIVLYDPAVHRPLATRFGQDAGVSILSHRAMALWLLGYPDAALADAKQALQEARDIGQSPTLMTQRQSRNPMKLCLWRTRRLPHYGKRGEC